MENLAELLKERDDAYRESKHMTSLKDLSATDHMEMTVMEQADVSREITDGVRCQKCGKNSIISYQIQIRAGDEGTNTLHRCTNKSCGNSYITK